MNICFYCRYEKGKKRFHVTVDNHDFDTDKEITLNCIPMNNWFEKAIDEDVEWEGLIVELEKFTNVTYKEYRIDVKGDEEEKSHLFKMLNDLGYSFMCSTENKEQGGLDQKVSINKQLENANKLYEEKKYDDAFSVYQRIQENSVEAKYMVAELYYFGYLTEEHSPSEALNIYMKCADLGFVPAYAKIARYFYQNAENSERENSYNWALKGHDNNDTLGTLYLARCNYYGLGCKEDKKESERLYKICVDSEERPTSYYELGMLYYNDERYDEAFKLFCLGAEKVNCSDCKLHMAICYEDGVGTETDEYKAASILISLSDESVEAKRQLARYYYDGIGVEINQKKSFELIEEVYEKDPDEINTIAYARVLANKGDLNKAESILKYSVESKFSGAKELLGKLFIQQKKYREALAVLKSAINDKTENEASVLKRIGDCFSDEDCGFYDTEEAFTYYKRAADLGNEDAMVIMFAKYRESGDEKKAQEYFDKAVEKGNSIAELALAETEYEKENYKKAKRIFKKYALQGNAEAQYKLALTYLKLNSIDDGIVWLKKAAVKGETDAYTTLAAIYSTDAYNKKDSTIAFDYLVKGSDAGNIECRRLLATKFLYDKDYIDENKGIELLKELIKEKDLDSKYALSMFYYAKYSRAICHNGFPSGATKPWQIVAWLGSVVAILFSRGVSLSVSGVLWVSMIADDIKYKKVTKRKRSELNDEDRKAIKELVGYFNDMKDDKRLNEESRKRVSMFLKAISEKFKE